MADVYQANIGFIDEDQKKHLTLFFVAGASQAEAESKIGLAAGALQFATECRFTEGYMLRWQNIARLRPAPAGSVDKMLTLFLESEPDVLSGRVDTYKIRIPSPDPAILTPDGTRFDGTSALGILFKQDFLILTTSVHGLPFRKVISGFVVKST